MLWKGMKAKERVKTSTNTATVRRNAYLGVCQSSLNKEVGNLRSETTQNDEKGNLFLLENESDMIRQKAIATPRKTDDEWNPIVM